MDKVMKKKIVLYISSLARGGMERVFVNLAHYFKAQGYDVVMVTQYRKEQEYYLDSNIPRVMSDLTESEMSQNRVVNLLKRIRKLHSIFRGIQPDLILTCDGKMNMMTLAASRGLKCKVVLSVIAEPRLEYYTKVMRFIARTFFVMADGIIVQTEPIKNFFPKWIINKCKILPNALNPEFIMERYTGNRKKEIVSVGRLDKNKNQAMLIRAFAEIAEEYPEYKVVLYGDGQERNNLQALIEEKGLSERITLAGRVFDVAEKIRKSEVFVLTTYSEGMPNALMEALVLGMAVVSTDCPSGGPRQLIENGVNGILIQPGDEKGLIEALRRLLSDQEYREKLGEQAYKLQEKLSPERVNAMWKDYLEEIMEARG